MTNIIIIYSIISFLLIFIIAVASYRLELVDIPNKRKKHLKPVAFTGGLSLSLAYIFSIQFFDIPLKQLNIILSISFLMSIVGFIDDKYNLNTGGKLSLQIIPIIYLIIIESLNLRQLGDYYFFKLELSSLSVPFSLICVLFLINAFNYFDGLDGILGSASISVLIILYFLTSDENIKLFLIIIILPIFIFLFFNFSFLNLPKIFLGDSGSLLLGFIVAFTLIYFANQKISHPILLAWSISIFVYEFLSVNLLRILNNKNIFEPSLDHLHHIMLKKTKSIFFTNILISTTNIIFFLIGYFSFNLIGSLTSFILFIFLFIIFFIIRKNIFCI